MFCWISTSWPASLRDCAEVSCRGPRRGVWRLCGNSFLQAPSNFGTAHAGHPMPINVMDLVPADSGYQELCFTWASCTFCSPHIRLRKPCLSLHSGTHVATSTWKSPGPKPQILETLAPGTPKSQEQSTQNPSTILSSPWLRLVLPIQVQPPGFSDRRILRDAGRVKSCLVPYDPQRIGLDGYFQERAPLAYQKY